MFEDYNNEEHLSHNDKLGIIVFTKELFCETVNEIERQLTHDHECAIAFQKILPNDHISGYDSHWILNQTIKIIQIAMNDYHEHSWIEYYMWELHFGRKWKKGMVKIKGKDFKLQTAIDLWDILNVA